MRVAILGGTPLTTRSSILISPALDAFQAGDRGKQVDFRNPKVRPALRIRPSSPRGRTLQDFGGAKGFSQVAIVSEAWVRTI